MFLNNMYFNEFGDYLEKLEQTSSRLNLIDLLAELFKQIKLKELSQVIYLIQGRVAPFYEPLEIGMAEKTVAASIAKAYGINREKILEEYGKVGDLGIVAEKYAEKHHTVGAGRVLPSTIKDVFQTLLGIAKTSGEGTVEKKVNALAGLLQKLSPIAAKHLVRIPIGASRLGIGDPTILDAFAKLKFGDRKNRKALEDAYNKTSDLGLIGQTLWRDGLRGVEKLEVTVGRPIRPELCERLPDPKTILEKYSGIANTQPKMDGFRVQIHLDRSESEGKQVRLFSRNLEETTAMLPEIIKGALKQIKAQTVILDSEALAYNPDSEEFLPFQETTKRRRKYDIEEMSKKLPLKAFVFDVMYLDGQSLIDLPLTQRIAKLNNLIEGEDVLIAEPGELVTKEERMVELFDDAITNGLEGLVVKKLDSKYEAGARNFNWVKLKRHSAGELKDTIDAVILGYIYGKGKRAEFGAGSLLVGIYDAGKDEFVTVSKIGTGLTDEEWKEVQVQSSKFKVQSKPARVNSLIIPSVWVQPKIVIEVLADEITRSPIHTAGLRQAQAKAKQGEAAVGYALRFPRLVRFREQDKKPEDATTVKELIEMYNLQGKQ